jgi:hypothetical protein
MFAHKLENLRLLLGITFCTNYQVFRENFQWKIRAPSVRGKAAINIVFVELPQELTKEISSFMNLRKEKCSSTSRGFFSILWGRCCSNHTQEDKTYPDLATCEWKKLKTPALVWRPAGTYSLNMANSDFSPRSMATWGHFFPSKLLYEVALHFFMSRPCKNSS